MQERAKSQRMGRKLYDDGKVEIRKPKSAAIRGSNDIEDVDFEEVD